MAQAQVFGEDGWTGVVNDAVLSGSSAAGDLAAIRLEPDGPVIYAPRELLVARSDGSFYLPLRRDALTAYQSATSGAMVSSEAAITIPLIEESLSVTTERVPIGTVRIVKTVGSRDELVDEPLTRDEVSVERIAVNRVLDAPVAVRYEGDVTIIPLMEETLIVEKRLVLREELHIRKTVAPYRDPVTVTLRRENAAVSRVTTASDGYELAEDAKPKTVSD